MRKNTQTLERPDSAWGEFLIQHFPKVVSRTTTTKSPEDCYCKCETEPNAQVQVATRSDWRAVPYFLNPGTRDILVSMQQVEKSHLRAPCRHLSLCRDCSRWQEVSAQASDWAILQELTLNSCTRQAASSAEREAHLHRHKPLSRAIRV